MTSTPRDPGYATDFIFHEINGFVEEHPDHWVIRTPDNPEFWFGNFLLFKRAPRAGDLERWLKCHEAAFSSTLNHHTFGWDDSSTGELTPFDDAGFRRSFGESLILTHAPENVRVNPQLQIRPLDGEADWHQAIDLQVSCDRDDFSYPGSNWDFRQKQAQAYRRMINAGRGQWWGAWHGEQLVGSMGLFFNRDRSLGRFQNVATHQDWRRQRVCTTLLNHVVRHAFAEVGARSLVICTSTDEDNPAAPAYRNFGFKFSQSSGAVTRLRSGA